MHPHTVSRRICIDKIDRQFNTLCVYLLKTRLHKRNVDCLQTTAYTHNHQPIHPKICMYIMSCIHITLKTFPFSMYIYIFAFRQKQFYHMVMCIYSFVQNLKTFILYIVVYIDVLCVIL